MTSPAKFRRQLDQLAAGFGFAAAEYTGSGHLRYEHANGGVVIAPSTPSGRGWQRRVVAKFRRVARMGSAS